MDSRTLKMLRSIQPGSYNLEFEGTDIGMRGGEGGVVATALVVDMFENVRTKC